MRRFRKGEVTKEDLKQLNTRYFEYTDIVLPPITKLRCACYRNSERNSYNNIVFLQHLAATHTKTEDYFSQCPSHICTMKATIYDMN